MAAGHAAHQLHWSHKKSAALKVGYVQHGTTDTLIACQKRPGLVSRPALGWLAPFCCSSCCASIIVLEGKAVHAMYHGYMADSRAAQTPRQSLVSVTLTILFFFFPFAVVCDPLGCTSGSRRSVASVTDQCQSAFGFCSPLILLLWTLASK